MKCRTTLAVKLATARCAHVSIVLLTGQPPRLQTGTTNIRARNSTQSFRALDTSSSSIRKNWSFDSLYGQFPGADGLSLFYRGGHQRHNPYFCRSAMNARDDAPSFPPNASGG